MPDFESGSFGAAEGHARPPWGAAQRPKHNARVATRRRIAPSRNTDADRVRINSFLADPGRIGGRGVYRRRQPPADLVADLSAIVAAGAADGGDLHLSVDLERFLWPADLPDRPRELHPVDRHQPFLRVDGRWGHRQRDPVYDGDCLADDTPDDRRVFSRAALLHRRDRADGSESLGK